MTCMPRLNDDEIGQLKEMGWFLLFINLSIIGIGIIISPLLIAVDTLNTVPALKEAYSAALPVILGAAVFVNGAFGLIVGGNVLIVLVGAFLRSRTNRETRRLVLSL